mmetsp:Transcript_26159/g.49118  ORF Transcript_26159/g.49118 Transcript_26159/m.49118 type:complete len:320 (-) Transcript_26159:328-1287(-)
MAGTLGAPPGLAPAPSLGMPAAGLNGGPRPESDVTDVKQEISNRISQQVQTLLLQAKKESEQKVTAELKLLHNVMQEMDARLDNLIKQLDETQVPPKTEALEQGAVVQALAKVEQQWGKELGKLKGELHQTIFAHNHNADLMKYQKETLDKIRQEIDARGNANPEKIKAAKAQVAKIETMSKGAQKQKLDPLLQRMAVLEQKIYRWVQSGGALGHATAAAKYPAVPGVPAGFGAAAAVASSRALAAKPPMLAQGIAGLSLAESPFYGMTGSEGFEGEVAEATAPALGEEEDDEEDLQSVVAKALVAFSASSSGVASGSA